MTAESAPLAAKSPREPDRRAIVSRGTRVYLRTLTPEDLDHLSVWAEDPVI